MKVKGYKIYLTSSKEVANIIACAKADNLDGKEDGYGEIARVSHGCAYGCRELPEHLRTTKYEYVLVEYEGNRPWYEIVFA